MHGSLKGHKRSGMNKSDSAIKRLDFNLDGIPSRGNSLSFPKINSQNESHVVKCQAHVRGWLARKTYRSMLPKYRRRSEIFRELLYTERTYVSQLRTIVESYMKPLRNNLSFASSHATVSEQDYNVLFSNLEALVFYNGVFLDNLERRAKEWDPLFSKLGDIFLVIADFTQLYAKYMTNHKSAVARVQLLTSQSKEFVTFLATRKLPPDCSKFTLVDFMARPNERMDDYLVLLEDLIRHSWDYSDHKNLCSARSQIVELVGSAKDAVKVEERLKGSKRAKSPNLFGRRTQTKNKISVERDKKKEFSQRTSSANLVTKKLIPRDEDLWEIFSIALNGMELKEQTIRAISQTAEDSLTRPPRRTKTLLLMRKIHKISAQFMEKNLREVSSVKIQSFFRGWRERKTYYQLQRSYGRNLESRNRAFRELLTTERVYVRNLEVVVKEYLLSIRELRRKKGILISPGDLAIIFSNVESLYEVHLKMLSLLEEENKKWPDLNGIGDLFIKMGPSFDQYTEYVKNFKHASNTLSRCKQENEKLATFIKEVYQKVGQGLDLHMLLTCPLNRISQYSLQLEILYRMTPGIHEDYNNIVTAYSQSTELLHFIEESIVQSENQARLFDVKRRIDVTNHMILNVFDEDRMFLKEGPVVILEGKKKGNRYIFLFDDLCLVTKPQTKTKNFQYLRTIPLNDKSRTTLSVFPESSSLRHAFKLVSSDGEINIFLWKNQSEYKEWLKLVKQVVLIKEGKKKKGDKKPKLLEAVRRAKKSTEAPSAAQRKYKTWGSPSSKDEEESSDEGEESPTEEKEELPDPVHPPPRDRSASSASRDLKFSSSRMGSLPSRRSTVDIQLTAEEYLSNLKKMIDEGNDDDDSASEQKVRVQPKRPKSNSSNHKEKKTKDEKKRK